MSMIVQEEKVTLSHVLYSVPVSIPIPHYTFTFFLISPVQKILENEFNEFQLISKSKVYNESLNKAQCLNIGRQSGTKTTITSGK